MKRYVAEVIVTACDFLCALCNHYPLPCLWTRHRLYNWAHDVLWPIGPSQSPAEVVAGMKAAMRAHLEAQPDGVLTTYGNGTTQWVRWNVY